VQGVQETCARVAGPILSDAPSIWGWKSVTVRLLALQPCRTLADSRSIFKKLIHTLKKSIQGLTKIKKSI
jgi:hypothetical protein